uniref:Sulfotransferase domain-containing protein n=1 Tax=Amphora coffeiformis TaxID=265554 RepID=A0A7S3LDG8_9STRA|eukprot:scaffold307_cov162-Amphora_coffeaeformis.AAC.9
MRSPLAAVRRGSGGSGSLPRRSYIVAMASFVAGALSFVALSQVAQFLSALELGSRTLDTSSKIPSVQTWLAEFPENKAHVNDENKSNNKGVPEAINKAIVFSTEKDSVDNEPLPPWPFESPAHVRVLFVHVGKAGGMSLNARLKVLDQTRKFLKCRQKYETDEQFLKDKCRITPGMGGVSKLTLRLFGHMHRSFPEDKKAEKWLVEHSNLLLFTIRDPIARLTSAFNYARYMIFEYNPKKERDPQAIKFYKECFANMDECASALDPRNSTKHACSNSALPIVQGRTQVPDLDHFYYNYAHYIQRVEWTPGDVRPIVVVRTESMWTDVGRINAYVGGKPDYFEQFMDFKLTHGSESFAVNKELSDAHGVAMCCILAQPGHSRELQNYQELVVHAINLKISEKRQTLRSLHHNCGIAGAADLTWEHVSTFNWATWHAESCHL